MDRYFGTLEAVMLYYWGISLALSEILPELVFILIPIGLLFYLLPYWHVILGATLVVFMWVHWDSLHWWSSSSSTATEQTQAVAAAKNEFLHTWKSEQTQGSRLWQCSASASPGSTTKITCE
jgi:hypothetical protein